MATEENPLMAYFLAPGPWPFMTAKFLLTCFAILILLVFHNFYFRPLRVHVKVFFPAFIAFFALVITWHFFLDLLILTGPSPLLHFSNYLKSDKLIVDRHRGQRSSHGG